MCSKNQTPWRAVSQLFVIGRLVCNLQREKKNYNTSLQLNRTVRFGGVYRFLALSEGRVEHQHVLPSVVAPGRFTDPMLTKVMSTLPAARTPQGVVLVEIS